ncbi:MAG: insulinase family protein, partial [Myxococcota bacterium]
MNALERVERHRIGQATVISVADTAFPACRVVVAFRGGAMFDPAGAAGAHRVLAELLLRGTDRLSRDALHARFERLGSSIYASTYGDMIMFRLNC